jgi:ATP-dependent helicase/nuclease subunit A
MHQTEGQWLLQNGAIDLEGIEIKIQTFLFLLTEFRNMVNHTSIYDMISIFLERTGYYHYVMAMPGGKRRQINIDMLKERAAAYENGIYKGLFYFIRYIEKMQKINLDMGEASTISETDNTVRIMTIHKSKGLEFPIVFLCNIGKNFNFRDSQGRYVLHHDLGVGFDYLDQETRVRKKTAVKMVIERQLRLDVVQEEIRLLYVACTRAKEKLILVHQPIGEKRIRGLLEAASYQEELLPKALRTSAKSYFDMIGVSMCRNQAFVPIYTELGEEWPVEQALYNQNFYLTVKRIMPEALQEKLLKDVYVQEVNLLGLETMTETKTDSALAQELRERLEYQYPYQAAVESYGKVSVSDIKKISYESEIPTAVSLIKEDSAVPEDTKEFVPTVPAFMQTEGILSAANRGTAYHKVFEWFDYSVNHTAETITEMIDHMQQQGWLSKEERAQIKDNDFLIFAQSDLGHRMQAASQRGMLYREAQFVMGLYQSEIRQYEAFAQTGQMEQGDSLVPEEDETVLMQGIIDAYFIEDDKIVIVDYKTDNVPNLEVLKKHYFVQLALYQRALEQLTEKEVSEKLLYSTKFGTACNV